ncbi:putative phage abortive infection protein [Agrobacterium tumefaciens]|uniref:putative phage abortive infection protein n=1 Tax=Agrobacterium tumefaciens TaxID=358 RepID=UPI0015726C46|nr:putative phage abortive infection protein [Agrobacterium tumefaciens]WCJ61886.1 putative phage abortive infection protein [Agrobacterium tumefaciens]
MQRLILIITGIVAVGLWLVCAALPILLPRLGWEWQPNSIGPWGDTFGALNAMFSALAFVAVLFTLTQQQKQIDDAATDQHLQRFERTFYELLRLLREARDAVEYRYSDQYEGGGREREKDYEAKVWGTEAFKRAQFEMAHWVGVWWKNINEPPSSDDLASLYTRFVHDRYESTFAPYYRLLYTTLMRIKTDPKLSDEDKNRYGNLLRSQLTSHEVAMCCYNGLAAVSGSFKQLLTEFRMIKYLPLEFGRDIFTDHYDPIAFLGRDDAEQKL